MERGFLDRGNSRGVSDRSLRRKHSVDGICDLPDSILGHILSFLPTKNAVATHVLSQRWKFLWTTTINLDFHYSKSGHHGNGRFVSFVNYVLLLHKPGFLNRFSLTWGTWCIPFHVNTWLSIAVARNVHELSVHASTSRLQIQVLRSIFSCEGLRSLELNCEICISPELVVSLPRLENLKLVSIYFQSEEDFCKLFVGCPVLKYLYIDMDIGKMIRYLPLDIDDFVFEYMLSSTSLRRLEIYVHGEHSELEGTLLCIVRLDAPSLEYIKLDDLISTIFIQQKRLTSLVEADIQLAYLDSVSEEESYCNFIVETFCAFDYARTIALSAQVSRALSCATTKMRSMFNKLTRLEVKIDWNHWSSVQDFIELSDNLEVLTIHKDYDSSGDHYNNSNWKNPKVIPRCLSSSLKTVSIMAYDGHQDELEMIGYILKYGSVLQVLEIRFGESIDGFKTISEELRKILKFPRKSPVCEVELR